MMKDRDSMHDDLPHNFQQLKRRKKREIPKNKIKTNLKIVLIGDSGVGKSSLIQCFQFKEPAKRNQKPTIGADFIKKTVTLDDGNQVSM